MLSSVLEWQQGQEGAIEVKCEEPGGRNAPFQASTLRLRARLRRGLAPHQTVCDRNGNNLLMIAPNNHLCYKRQVMFVDATPSLRRIKHELDEKDKEDKNARRSPRE